MIATDLRAEVRAVAFDGDELDTNQDLVVTGEEVRDALDLRKRALGVYQRVKELQLEIAPAMQRVERLAGLLTRVIAAGGEVSYMPDNFTDTFSDQSPDARRLLAKATVRGADTGLPSIKELKAAHKRESGGLRIALEEFSQGRQSDRVRAMRAGINESLLTLNRAYLDSRAKLLAIF